MVSRWYAYECSTTVKAGVRAGPLPASTTLITKNTGEYHLWQSLKMSHCVRKVGMRFI